MCYGSSIVVSSSLCMTILGTINLLSLFSGTWRGVVVLFREFDCLSILKGLQSFISGDSFSTKSSHLLSVTFEGDAIARVGTSEWVYKSSSSCSSASYIMASLLLLMLSSEFEGFASISSSIYFSVYTLLTMLNAPFSISLFVSCLLRFFSLYSRSLSRYVPSPPIP